MRPSRALVIVAVIGIAIFALSFVNGWIVHDREIRGEGYRHSVILLSAWRSVALPILGLGVCLALATAAGAVARLSGVALPGWLVAAGAVASLGLIASSVAPIGWDGHTTSIDLRPAPLTWVGIGLGLGLALSAALAARPSRRGWGLLAALGVVLFVAGVAGRQVVLTASGPSNQDWSDGTYVLTGDGGQVALVVGDGRFSIGDRWGGTWEGSGGWTVALDDDPACPGSRGAYHVRDAGEEGRLLFVKIVDTCQDGARAEMLESGTWERQP
jgi:hypothetical protein